MLCIATTAAADPVRVLSVQDGKLAPDVVAAALAGFSVPAACATADRTVVAWVEYEHGKAVDATVTKGDVEACVAKALRGTKLETGAGRIGVALLVKVEVDKPGRPKVALLATENHKVLDAILDKNLSMNLGKFTGIKGADLKAGSTGFGSGTGTGNGIGPGGGTGTTRGTKGAGGNASGDFVAGGPSKSATMTMADPKVDADGWSADEINRVIKARAGIFRACYQRELHEHPDLSGKVVIRFRIVGDGHVENASIASTTLHSLAVEECIKANVLRLRFPARDGLANVNYPFVFASAN